MGVEYVHHWVVAEPEWVGVPDHVRRVHGVLLAAGLVDREPQLFDVAGSEPRQLACALFSDELDVVRELVAVYPDGAAGAPVADVVGPSCHPVPPEERYVQRIFVVAGEDHRIHPRSETSYVEVQSGSSFDGAVHAGVDSAWRCLFEESYPGPGCEPPRTTFHVEEGPAVPDFEGRWRGALCFDCGKDVPAIADGRGPRRAARAFGERIAEAFGAKVVELGYID